jgi:hypothetical protein
VIIESTKPVTETLDEQDIQTIVDEIASDFDVSTNEVDVNVDYTITGMMQIDVSGDDVDPETVENEIKQALAQLLNIWESNIDVVYNETTGEVTYTITMDSYDVIKIYKMKKYTRPFIVWLFFFCFSRKNLIPTNQHLSQRQIFFC